MAAINGFNTMAPDAQYGNDMTLNRTNVQKFAQRHVCGGSGDQDISTIGSWLFTYGNEKKIRFGIFSHDAVNNCPEALVADGLSPESVMPYNTSALVTSSYVTKPRLTGGNTYWICGMAEDTVILSRFTTGGVSLRAESYAYGTWPTPTEWETHTDGTSDFALFAVYGAASSADWRKGGLWRELNDKL